MELMLMQVDEQLKLVDGVMIGRQAYKVGPQYEVLKWKQDRRQERVQS